MVLVKWRTQPDADSFPLTRTRGTFRVAVRSGMRARETQIAKERASSDALEEWQDMEIFRLSLPVEALAEEVYGSCLSGDSAGDQRGFRCGAS
jgi:hypothetical protein